MPEHHVKTVFDFLSISALWCALGGIVKILFGVAKGTMTFLGAFTALFVAVLFGVTIGALVESWSESIDAGNVARVIVGIMAYNLAEAVEGLGFRAVLQSIVNRRGKID